jgi:superfamily II DNA or RNA helicase
MSEHKLADSPCYKVGDIVAFKTDPSRQGPIVEILTPIKGQNRYRVFHSPEDIREYLHDQIILLEDIVENSVSEDELSSGEFLACLNALRLNHPQVDSIYALYAARIQFIPFQFKPLLRFLRADRPRLLIADEVGVGKTIEAGLILRELESRQELGNVLVVCPKALVTKWRAEMRRFDEDFIPMSSEQLRYCLRETDLDGAWPSQYSRAIIHLELLRREEYLAGKDGRRPLPGLATLSPPPKFDLVIVDEAHHVRNPDTLSHQVAEFLCDVSEAAILMTATPIQIGAENLFHLLNLLRPDQFIDFAQFQEMAQPNRYLNRAIRFVRTKQPPEQWYEKSQTALVSAAETDWGKQVLKHDPRFARWKERLQKSDYLDDKERVRFIRDIEEVHTLAHVMNRTRRRDIGRFTIREPYTVGVPFTESQQAFYDALIAFRREMLALDYPQSVIRLITDTLERQAASCLPALVPALDSFLRTGKFRTEELTDDLEWDGERDLPPSLVEKARGLRAMAFALPPDEDPKLDKLKHIVSDTVKSSGPRKVLVFSFFLHTLSYLEHQLREAGYRVAVVNGRVDDEIREILRNRFRLPNEHNDAIDILLSSEVGCEGLDYEFCNRLVNYDIPWNPMRVEQRIGRIDRFGQQSEKVQIYNFVTPGTVEERIVFRCYDRLGIFRDTIGDIEEVLGRLTQAINDTALDISLTKQQAEEKAKQLADNALREIEEQRRLEERSKELLGLDRALLDEVEKVQEEGRFISPLELRQMIDEYLAHRCENATILGDGKREGVVKIRANRDDRERLRSDLYQLQNQDRTMLETRRWLIGDEPLFAVTFHQKTALEHRDVPFITPIHALTKMAIKYWNSYHDKQLVTQVKLETTEYPAGRYVFAYYLWETVSIDFGISLISLVWDLTREKLSQTMPSDLPSLLRQGHDAQIMDENLTREIELALHKLEEAIHEKRQAEVTKLIKTNKQLAEQQLASLARYYDRRVARIDEELSAATDRRIQRMKNSELRRIQQEQERRQREIEARKKADIISQRVAYGLLEVHKYAN